MKSERRITALMKELQISLKRLENKEDLTVLELSNLEILKASYKQRIDTLKWVLEEKEEV